MIRKWLKFASVIENHLRASKIYMGPSFFDSVLLPAKRKLSAYKPHQAGCSWRCPESTLIRWCTELAGEIVNHECKSMRLSMTERMSKVDKWVGILRGVLVEVSKNEGWIPPFSSESEKSMLTETEKETERMDSSMRAFDCFLRVCKEGKMVSMTRLTAKELVIAVDATQARAKCLMMEGIAKQIAEDANGDTKLVLTEVNAA